MRDIYLIAKFSNMDIIILFLFINLSTSPSPSPASHSTFPLLHFVVQNIPFLLHINRPLYRAKKKDYHLHHARTCIRIHTLSLLLIVLLIKR